MNEKEFTERLIAALPEAPGDAVIGHKGIKSDLGKPLLIYCRENVPDEFSCDYIYNGVVPKVRYRWGARCFCTECGEYFNTGYTNQKVIIRMGEDGCAYTGWVGEHEPDAYTFGEGDVVRCPMCDTVLRVTSKRSLRNGRTSRTQIAELINAGGIGCILYWIAEQRLNQNGYEPIEFYPREVIAVTPEGRLRRYSHMKEYMTSESPAEHWDIRTVIRDPEALRFLSEGMNVCGAWYAKPAPGVMTGTTAEKTGLEEYFHSCDYPATYLKLWHLHRNVENLVRTGWKKIVESTVRRCIGGIGYYNGAASDMRKAELFNWKENKPHRMIGISKEDYKALAGVWTCDHLVAYRRYEERWPGTSPRAVQQWISELGSPEVFGASSPCWDEDMHRVMSYIRKQKEKCGFTSMADAMQQYVDYLRMIAEVNMVMDAGAITLAEQWPPQLRNAHDRQVRIRRNMESEIKDKKKDAQWGDKFTSVHEKMEGLEWNDGRFCVVIPCKPSDLVKEGHTLNHCVGGYSEQHVSGKPIFFIRHYRRPERSWYTLNENLLGDAPERIQLHGYGNERAHGKRLRIPEEVIQFVETWEREILAPWYQKNKGKVTA